MTAFIPMKVIGGRIFIFFLEQSPFIQTIFDYFAHIFSLLLKHLFLLWTNSSRSIMFRTTKSINIVGSYWKRSASEKVLEIFSINFEHDNSALVQNPYFTNEIQYTCMRFPTSWM